MEVSPGYQEGASPVLRRRRCVWVNGPVIVGAGPSGLAVGACLRDDNVPFVILERSDCIASLWQKRTYDRLKLHIPKQFCQLPKLPFPEDFPDFPTKNQFIGYLESYARKFEISPRFNECVQSAWYDKGCGLWRVWSVKSGGGGGGCGEEELMEYICQWIVVATGENAQSVMPEMDGMDEFVGSIIHASEYKSGEAYHGKRVLVVGCGNSGMELSLDLCHHHAFPSMVVRDSGGVELVDGRVLPIDSVILATGYRSNVPSWLHDSDFFSKDGFPKMEFPCGWKGDGGLYAVGFTRRGLFGAAMDAVRIADDIGRIWKEERQSSLLPAIRTASDMDCICQYG